ncbi:hypothetical protein FS749_013239 [Ceratobasidium sp. UAMH 11750]|nr:hypothetical protein FS749_013239 [Ceratobasidium sp. UAMH 11750]
MPPRRCQTSAQARETRQSSVSAAVKDIPTTPPTPSDAHQLPAADSSSPSNPHSSAEVAAAAGEGVPKSPSDARSALAVGLPESSGGSSSSGPAPPPWLSETMSTPSQVPSSPSRASAASPPAAEPRASGGQTTAGESTPSSASPIPSTSQRPAPTSPSTTGNTNLDAAVDELRDSPFWIGNPGRIFQNCEWSDNGAKKSSILKWKPDAPEKPEDADDEALIGWVGQVPADGSLRADGGWKPYFPSAGAPKHKRNVRAIRPPVSRHSLVSMWEAQLRGARAVVDVGRRSHTGNLTNVKFCFLENETGALRSRSPMFKNKDEAQDDDVPFSHYFSTWDFASQEVRQVMDDVISKGYTPQVVPAYDEHDQLIHPNDVENTLKGALVCVFCTLEKMLFTGNSQPGGCAWQFYSNLVKVQVLEPAPPEPGPTSRKRKFVPTLGSSGSKQKRPAVG